MSLPSYGRALTLLLAALLAGGGAARLRADEPPAVQGGVESIQEDINQAIDRGVLWLMKQQLADGSWGQDADRYPGGMTGLALYTCLKSGVPLAHPCIQLGFENLLSIDPEQTYVVACHLLALGATGDPTHRPRMAKLVGRLQSWRVRGSWSYPLAHEGPGWAVKPGRLDLSNTQFAVLGLRAAHEAGIEIPRKTIQGIVRQTRFHQQLPKDVGGTDADGAPRAAAGFAYNGPGQQGLGAATGSMTCAGITVLDVCRRMLGRKLSSKNARKIDDAIRHAVTWLDEHWSVEENPGQAKSHKLYYLYGLERVGSLLGLERIGHHAWYAEGARELLKIQKKGGEWGTASETCFALLFLLRATKGEGTGGGRARSVLPVYVTAPDSMLRVRAEGHSPMRVWITSVHPDALPLAGNKGHPPFEKVEYLVDGRVELTVAQGASPHGADPTHGATLYFPHAGKFQVQALGYVHGPQGEVVLASTPFEVEIQLLVPPWAPYEARWVAADLIRRGEVRVEASSHHNAHQDPGKAVDVRTPGYWVCRPKPADPRPTLRIKLKKSVKANTIVLVPVPRRDGDRRRFDRPTGIFVVLNGKGDPIPVPLEGDELRPVVLRLPKTIRIKSLEVVIASRTPGASWPGESGFSEIVLEVTAVARPTFGRDSTGAVTLACTTPDAEIRYTLDGTLPTRNSPRYTGPFKLPGRTRLHAIATLPSGDISRPLVTLVRVPGEVYFR